MDGSLNHRGTLHWYLSPDLASRHYFQDLIDSSLNSRNDEANVISYYPPLCRGSRLSASRDSFQKKGTSYVIVGGGPAGLVLADRLSQSGVNKVTLLEAGPDTINNQLLQGD